MNETEIIQTIMSYVVDADDYARMQWSECTGVDRNTPYEDFLVWNETCINMLCTTYHSHIDIPYKKYNIIPDTPCGKHCIQYHKL
jgi:hypothetical protein